MPASTALPTRRLGTTDMNITRVGFGAWAIGGTGWANAWGAQDDSESVTAIRHAVARGINWIDTASIYGHGHSEEVVAAALKDMPASERPYVFTKCGMVWDNNDHYAQAQRLGSYDSLIWQTEHSLKRLGVEVIDLMQLHWPSTDVALEEYWPALLKLKADGKVRAVGLSNHDAGQLTRAEALGHVDTLQPPFSAIRRGAAEAELPWCAAHGTGVIVYSPMQSGLLTGRFTAERAASLGDDDWRSRNPNYQGEALTRNLALAEALKPIAEKHRTSVASVAIAWTLAFPGVTGAIVGARSPAQVDGWLDAATLELDRADMVAIGAAIVTTGAGAGPTMPVA
jgi:aryl-alcohol dehydrogenase-like predicted oxidoreductase